MAGGRLLKRRVLASLRQDDFASTCRSLLEHPHRRVVNPLFGLLYHGEQRVRWRAVSAMGVVTADLADRSLESARVVVRRLIWNLNDESGGIGWGSPEAMGDILARHDRLAGEYGHILLSYICPEGNFLEHPLLQRGVLWGVGRFARARPAMAAAAAADLKPFLISTDPIHRGLAAWTAGVLPLAGTAAALTRLQDDPAPLVLYRSEDLGTTTVGDLAREALGGG